MATAKPKPNEPITMDALPAGTVVELQGKQYPTHAGLLALAHAHGMTSMVTDVLSYQDGEAVVKATVEGSRGTYTGHGDASPANVGRNIVSAVLRMAETRSQNRAIRAYLGLGATTAEEMPPDALQGGGNRRPAPKAPTSAPRKPQTQNIQDDGPPCPECGGPMHDNREKRAGGWRGPAWKCKDYKNCPGVYWEASDAPAKDEGGDDGIPF